MDWKVNEGMHEIKEREMERKKDFPRGNRRIELRGTKGIGRGGGRTKAKKKGSNYKEQRKENKD